MLDHSGYTSKLTAHLQDKSSTGLLKARGLKLDVIRIICSHLISLISSYMKNLSHINPTGLKRAEH